MPERLQGGGRRGVGQTGLTADPPRVLCFVRGAGREVAHQ